jgi:predicted AAA+ superfamily ATPase
MIRYFSEYLTSWKKNAHRKPLIIRGARQVGKTFVIEKFGNEFFENLLKINFEEMPDLKQFFLTNDIEQIIQNVEIFFRRKIVPSKTLLFLDEIQTCPQAIVTLRYFYEKMPELHVIAAGSLLDHALNNLQYSMPVGRVEFAYMYPLNFYEFILALDEEPLVDLLRNYQIGQQIALPFHNKLMNYIRLYFFIGGMPEAVKVFASTKSLVDVERIHESIIKSFEFDFLKYGTRSQQNIMTKLMSFIPKACGQKFKYANFDDTLRSDAIRKAIDLLNMSRIAHIIHNTKSNGIPLEHDAVDKVFKALFIDIGLSNHILKLRISDIENLKTINEGMLAEQFIGQELFCLPPEYMESKIYYWMREKRNSEAEIDFLTQVGNKIIPIEVKAGKTGTLKSLHVFMLEKKLDIAVRFNSDLPSSTLVETLIKVDNGTKKVKFQMISLPFYLVREYSRLVEHIY